MLCLWLKELSARAVLNILFAFCSVQRVGRIVYSHSTE